jgi:hypothetical protein
MIASGERIARMAAMLKGDCDQLPRWLARRQPRDLIRTYHKCCAKIVRKRHVIERIAQQINRY